MRRSVKLLLPVVIVGAGLALWGCNKNLDDPTQADGILSIEKLEPVVIVSDITPTDPNTGLPTPLTTDSVSVTLKNRARTATTGTFNDIFVESSERICNLAGGGVRIAGGSGPAGIVVPIGATASVVADAVTLNDKLTTGAAVGDSWTCLIRFKGHDLAGNPVTTDSAGYSVNFVDK